MCEIFDESIGNEELEFANREWNKMNNSSEKVWIYLNWKLFLKRNWFVLISIYFVFKLKDGFRDGVIEGREKGLQNSFNRGYELSFGPFLTISSFEAIIE